MTREENENSNIKASTHPMTKELVLQIMADANIKSNAGQSIFRLCNAYLDLESSRNLWKQRYETYGRHQEQCTIHLKGEKWEPCNCGFSERPV